MVDQVRVPVNVRYGLADGSMREQDLAPMLAECDDIPIYLKLANAKPNAMVLSVPWRLKVLTDDGLTIETIIAANQEVIVTPPVDGDSKSQISMIVDVDLMPRGLQIVKSHAG